MTDAVQGWHVRPMAESGALALGVQLNHQFADLILGAGQSDHAVQLGHGLIE